MVKNNAMFNFTYIYLLLNVINSTTQLMMHTGIWIEHTLSIILKLQCVMFDNYKNNIFINGDK